MGKRLFVKQALVAIHEVHEKTRSFRFFLVIFRVFRGSIFGSGSGLSRLGITGDNRHPNYVILSTPSK